MKIIKKIVYFLVMIVSYLLINDLFYQYSSYSITYQYNNSYTAANGPISSPFVTIITPADTYTIDGSNKNNVSKKYYANNQSVTIKVSDEIFASDKKATAYRYSTKASQSEAIADPNKTLVTSFDQTIDVELDENKCSVYYIWLVDENGNDSKYVIRISLYYKPVIINLTGNYCYVNLPSSINGQAQLLKNQKESTDSTCVPSSKSLLPMTSDDESVDKTFEKEQLELVKRYFNKAMNSRCDASNKTDNEDRRTQAVYAAKFLTSYLNAQVEYEGNLLRLDVSVYRHRGLNIYNPDSCWNCTDNSSRKHGFQCSGFVTWVLLNAGVTLPYSSFPNIENHYLVASYLSGFESPYNIVKSKQWHTKDIYKYIYSNFVYQNELNASDTQLVENYVEGLIDKNLIVSSENIISISTMTDDDWSRIKPGDLIGYGTFEYDNEMKMNKAIGGHIGIITDVDSDGNWIYIAHSADWGTHATSGPQITRYLKSNLINSNWVPKNSDGSINENGWGNIILMDEVYDNVRNNPSFNNVNLSLVSNSNYLLDKNNGIISSVDQNSTSEEFLSNLRVLDRHWEGLNSAGNLVPYNYYTQLNYLDDFSVYDKNVILESDRRLKTGYTLKKSFCPKTSTDFEYKISIKGDVLGDGYISNTGCIKAANHIIDKNVLSGIYLKSADYDGNGQVQINDIIKMLKNIK